MKNKRTVWAIAVAAIFAMSLTVCKNEPEQPQTKELEATPSITPFENVTTYTELTANYLGSERINFYQWNRDGEPINNANTDKYKPSMSGDYTVTVSAAGYNPKTSNAVTVTALNFTQTPTISPTTNLTTYKQLTATYSGNESETVTIMYQWYKDDVVVENANTNKYTPSEAGSYTVTVSAIGYNPKESEAVTVALSNFSQTPAISPTTGVTTYKQLTANYSGNESETVTLIYQWKNNNTIVGTDSKTYTPTTAGNYTVTISAIGFTPKTSSSVNVALSDLSGIVTITAETVNFVVDKELTANYSGKETVTLSYQWKFGTANVGTNSNKFTPENQGSYTVTISAEGYKPITSEAVTVTGPQWTAVADSTFGTSQILAIAYANGKFVAGGGDGKMATSTDGITWTAVTDSAFGTGNRTIWSIAYGNGKFVAVGRTYTSSGGTNIYSGKMATSTDGTTWTAVGESTFGTSTIYAIAYANDKFVAGGGNGKMATSTDGTTWTAVGESTFGTSSILAITYANGKFVAGGYNGKMATSTDGVTWTAVADSTFGTTSDDVIKAIAYGNGKFVAVGWYYNAGRYEDGKMATSTDGMTWTAVADSTFVTASSDNINAIAYGNNRFVAVGDIGKMTVSRDGVTWTAVPSGTGTGASTFSNTISAITYANGKFVAGGTGGKMAYLLDE